MNLLLNSVVSTHAFFGSIDLTDYYLGTPLSHPQFIKIPTHLFSDSVLSHLHLHPFVQSVPSSKPYLLFRIDKTMYGLKEAGKLSHLRLISHLAAHGFFETTTPCLFRHVSRPITFVLVVVLDTKVIYHQREDNVTGNVTEETGGGGRVKAVGGKVGEETVLGQLACLLQSVHRFVDAEKEVGFAGGGRLDEGVKVKVREDRVREKVG